MIKGNDSLIQLNVKIEALKRILIKKKIKFEQVESIFLTAHENDDYDVMENNYIQYISLKNTIKEVEDKLTLFEYKKELMQKQIIEDLENRG